MTKKSNYEFRVHFVKHQVFYTPLYLCGTDYDTKFITEPYKESDAVLVDELFNGEESESNIIDLYITGGPDVVSYLRKKPEQRQRVYFWLPLVDRLPLPMVRHKKGKYNDYRLSDLTSNATVKDILSPPENTTLHYFASKFFDYEAFEKKYMDDDLNVHENAAILKDLQQNASIFKGKLRPQKDFDSIPEALASDPDRLAFYLSEDPDIHKLKRILPPMDVVVFTCIYTKSDVWNNLLKRNALIEFCKSVSLNINYVHDFNRFYRKGADGYLLNNELLHAMRPYFNNQEIKDISDIKRDGFIRTLKYLAQHRIFAVNLQTDLQLKSERVLEMENAQEDANGKKPEVKLEKDIYYKYRLYYWMSRGTVVNVNAEMDRLHEQDRSHAQFLESISASTHSLKTTINTLLGYALNTMKEMKEYDEECMEQLYEAKETLLINTELINVVSKLSTPNYTKQSRKKALCDAKIYSEYAEEIDIVELVQKYLNILNKDVSLNPKMIVLTNTAPLFIPQDFLKFDNLYPTRRFFQMAALTICENCGAYGKETKGIVPLSVELGHKMVCFKNPTSHDHDKRLNLTGNWNVIHSILQQLHIGEVDLNKKNNDFVSTIRNLYYGKN